MQKKTINAKFYLISDLVEQNVARSKMRGFMKI